MPRKRKTTATKHDTKAKRQEVINAKKAVDDLAPLKSTVPKYMKGTPAEKVWKRVIPMLNAMGAVKQADQLTVEALCGAYAVYLEAFASVQEHGEVEPIYKTPISPTGEMGKPEYQGLKKNPSVTTMTTAMSRIRDLSSDLGLNPASRSVLLSGNTDDDEDAPSLSELLNGNNTWDDDPNEVEDGDSK